MGQRTQSQADSADAQSVSLSGYLRGDHDGYTNYLAVVGSDTVIAEAASRDPVAGHPRRDFQDGDGCGSGRRSRRDLDATAGPGVGTRTAVRRIGAHLVRTISSPPWPMDPAAASLCPWDPRRCEVCLRVTAASVVRAGGLDAFLLRNELNSLPSPAADAEQTRLPARGHLLPISRLPCAVRRPAVGIPLTAPHAVSPQALCHLSATSPLSPILQFVLLQFLVQRVAIDAQAGGRFRLDVVAADHDLGDQLAFHSIDDLGVQVVFVRRRSRPGRVPRRRRSVTPDRPPAVVDSPTVGRWSPTEAAVRRQFVASAITTARSM